MKKFFSFLTLLVILFGTILLSPADQINASSAPAVSYDRAFDYDHYSVKRFSNLISDTWFTIDPGTPALRQAGVLLVAPLMTGSSLVPLYVLREGALRLEPIGFETYTINTGIFCYTSQCQNPAPMIAWLDNKAVVERDGSWYTFDPLTNESQLWFTPPASDVDPVFIKNCAEMNSDTCLVYAPYPNQNVSATDATYLVTTLGDGLLFTTNLRDNDPEHFVGHWVPVPGSDEVIYEKPETAIFSSGDAWWKFDTSSLPDHPSDLLATSSLSDGTVIGETGTDIYAYKNNQEIYLGYSNDRLLYTFGEYKRVPITPRAALAFGQRSVAWVGVNSALYVAELK